MTYSLTPIETLDTIHSHSGFQLLTFLIIVIIIMFDYKSLIMWLIGIILVSIVALISWNTGEIITYKNQVVTGHLVRFQPEVWAEVHHHPTSITTSIERKMYVVYEVEGNEIIFDADKRIEYPQSANLYKN
jgi:hypothetical protein